MQTTIKDSSKSRLLLSLILLVIIGLAVIASLFQLWEQDINWQIKAGREILKTATLQRTEQWSYTANGTPWFNYQWLATAVLAEIDQLFQVPGLVLFRGLLLLSLLGLLVTVVKKTAHESFLIVSAILLPFFYSAIAPRIQIRPEFFVIVLHALILLVWASQQTNFRKFLLSLIVLVLATNLHPGVVPFLILTVTSFILQSALSKERKSLFITFTGLAFFATPYASGLPSFLLRHLNYEAHTILPNPEYFPLSLEDFNSAHNSLYAWSWVLMTVFFFIGAFRMKKRDTFSLISFSFLSLLAMKAPRAIPFVLLFGFPTIILGIHYVSQRAWAIKNIYPILAFCLVWEIAQVKTDPSPLGLKSYDYDLPDSTLAFIKKHRPQGNILHAPSMGDFLLTALPTYPVLFDSREIPYDHLQTEIRSMFEVPQAMTHFIQKYNVQTLLLPMTFIFAPPVVQGMNRRESFFPSTEWAIVAYDQTAMLLLKRIPAHRELIAQYEYKFAVPDTMFDPSSTEVKKELERCRQENPKLPFCRQ